MRRGLAMEIEELLDECVRREAAGEDIAPLLARHLAERAEVERLLALAAATRRLRQATLDPAARARLQARLQAHLTAPPAPTPSARMQGEISPDAVGQQAPAYYWEEHK